MWRQTPVELGTSWQFSTCGPVGWPSSFPHGGLALPYSIIVLTSTQVLPTNDVNCRVSVWGVSFTVDVGEPKPNRPNTMNLVEKRAQELGLCEDFVNGRAESLGSRIINGVVGERVKVHPRALSEDEFFFSSSDIAQLELFGVLRIAVPLFVRSLWLYILLPPSSWPSIYRLCKSLLECLSHPALPSTCCELQWTTWRCSGVIPSLMWPDCQLRVFSGEVTGSFTIALSPCFHSCPPTLVPSFGDDGEGCGGWRIALSSQDTSSPRT